MNLIITALLFNFIICCWPKTNIINRLRQHYGQKTVTLLRKLEKTMFKRIKVELDIQFITKCKELNLIS